MSSPPPRHIVCSSGAALWHNDSLSINTPSPRQAQTKKLSAGLDCGLSIPPPPPPLFLYFFPPFSLSLPWPLDGPLAPSTEWPSVALRGKQHFLWAQSRERGSLRCQWRSPSHMTDTGWQTLWTQERGTGNECGGSALALGSTRRMWHTLKLTRLPRWHMLIPRLWPYKHHLWFSPSDGAADSFFLC